MYLTNCDRVAQMYDNRHRESGLLYIWGICHILCHLKLHLVQYMYIYWVQSVLLMVEAHTVISNKLQYEYVNI